VQVEHRLVYTHPVLPPNVLEAPAGEEEDLDEDVEQEEDGADDVQVERALVYTHPVLPPNVLEAPAGEEEDLYEDVEQEEGGADDAQVEHGLVYTTVPRVQREEDQVRPDCSFAPTQLALCLRFALLKGDSCYAP
jgi:hypothetical protein